MAGALGAEVRRDFNLLKDNVLFFKQAQLRTANFQCRCKQQTYPEITEAFGLNSFAVRPEIAELNFRI